MAAGNGQAFGRGLPERGQKRHRRNGCAAHGPVGRAGQNPPAIGTQGRGGYAANVPFENDWNNRAVEMKDPRRQVPGAGDDLLTVGT